MKKVIFTLLLSLILSGAYAFRGSSELNLKLYDNSMFYVVLDNVTFNLNKQAYTFNELIPGNHFLTVVKVKPYMSSYGYSFQSNTVFAGYIYIPGNKKIFSMINSFGKFIIIGSSPYLGADDTPVNYEPTGYFNPAPGYEEFYYENDETQLYNYPAVTYNYSPVISAGSFSALMSTISSSSFDSSKQNLAKQAIASNWFTSAQICEMLKLFTFESSKLAVAKAAYEKAIDKSNYFMVNNVFTFESSIEELSAYIAAK